MKTKFLSSLSFFIALIIPLVAKAQDKVSNEKSSNDIALEALEHIKEILAATIPATDPEKAVTAATTVTENTKKIVALHAILKATPMPTVEEKKAFAQKMLQYEPQVAVIIKKMTNTFDTNSEEVNAIIQPAMTSFQEKIKNTMDLINVYYPKEEMDGYMNELKGK
jgi:hypothetical protein